MKKLSKYILVLIAAAFITSCDIYNPDEHYYDYNPPSEPTGIVVVNGDNRVDLYWNENRESDLAGYNVYYSYEYDGRYELIGSTEINYFIDRDVDNGTTYYYAVTAYDYNGNESELSLDVVYATPRPEGFDQSIFDFHRFPENSGYAFSEYQVVPYDNIESDLFWWKKNQQ